MSAPERVRSEQYTPPKGLLRTIFPRLFRTETPAEAAPPPIETYPETHPIIEAAKKAGIELAPDRLSHLVQMARTDDRIAHGAYADAGLFITTPFAGGGKTASEVTFFPVTQSGRRATRANPREATEIAHIGLTRMQDYALLADANILTPPDEFYGRTNPAMARTATRLGFSIDKDWNIEAPYKTVHDRVLSPDMVAFSVMLSQRLATRGQG